MSSDPLDSALQALARQALHPAPADLEQRVWRSIRARRASAAAEPWTARLFTFCWEPRLALASFALAAFVGVAMNVLLAPRLTHPDLRPARADFELAIFSAEPPALPSTLLQFAARHE